MKYKNNFQTCFLLIIVIFVGNGGLFAMKDISTNEVGNITQEVIGFSGMNPAGYLVAVEEEEDVNDTIINTKEKKYEIYYKIILKGKELFLIETANYHNALIENKIAEKFDNEIHFVAKAPHPFKDLSGMKVFYRDTSNFFTVNNVAILYNDEIEINIFLEIGLIDASKKGLENKIFISNGEFSETTSTYKAHYLNLSKIDHRLVLEISPKRFILSYSKEDLSSLTETKKVDENFLRDISLLTADLFWLFSLYTK